MLMAMGLCSCHRPQQPWDPDMRFDKMWRTPKDTFATWKKATMDADQKILKECYWSGLTREEINAWLGVNLRPETKALLRNATWMDIRPKSAVEINFRIKTSDGCVLRGVMVRTAQGWKIQSW